MNSLNNLMENMPQNVDGVIISEASNRRYFTNFSSTAGVLIVSRRKAILLLDFRYFEMAKNKVKGVEVRCFTDLNSAIGDVLRCENLKNVALESFSVSVKQFEDYKKNFEDVNFVVDGWLDECILNLKSIKSSSEIEKIRASQEVTDAAFSHILNFICIGKTEKEVAREIENFILDNAQCVSFPTIVVSGRNSSLPHGTPSDKRLESGDFVTMDFGAVVDGYCSDMTRTVCMSSPSNFQRELYSIVLNGQKLALKNIKQGVVCNDVDRLVRNYFEKYNYVEEFGHGLGHGVGLNIHEEPYLNRVCDTVLEENMVVTVEPGLYINSKMGVRIEDLVVVQKDGIVNLTNSSKELICI